MIAETYTANNRDGQTWLVADNPYQADNGVIIGNNYEWKRFKEQHTDIILTDHLPDGTKVRGDEIEVKWQYKLSGIWWDEKQGEAEYMRKAHGFDTRQVATLKHPDSYREREVVEDLALKNIIFKYKEEQIAIYSSGHFFALMNKEEIKAPKSRINKIEL